MKKLFQYVVILVVMLFVMLGNLGAEEVTVPLTNPDAACTVKASLHRGGITITGYNGKVVVVKATLKKQADNDRKSNGKDSKGLKRIPNASMDLMVEEEDNTVRIRSGSIRQTVDLDIQVPFKSSLKLSCHHNGNIVVDQIQGEVEAHNHHGTIKLTNISGTAMANTHHGEITVGFNRLNPDSPLSFTTYHGNINLTLPTSTKAKVKMRSDRGEFFTDFDMKVQKTPAKIEKRDKVRGRYRVKIEKGVYGTINGGGMDISLKTYHGNIYIRKGK